MSHVAVVTGGASGLGLSICEHLARQGQRMAVLDLDAAAAEQAAVDLRSGGAEAFAVGVDVSDRASVDKAITAVRSELGPIGILVTSAGVSGFVQFEQLTVDDWSRSIDVNLTGTFNCAQSVIGDMVAAGWGRIVTISSAAGQTGVARQVPLLRVQGRRHRAHQGIGARVRRRWHHSEHDPAVHCRHAHASFHAAVEVSAQDRGARADGSRRPPRHR